MGLAACGSEIPCLAAFLPTVRAVPEPFGGAQRTDLPCTSPKVGNSFAKGKKLSSYWDKEDLSPWDVRSLWFDLCLWSQLSFGEINEANRAGYNTAEDWPYTYFKASFSAAPL